MRTETQESLDNLFTARWNLPTAAKNCGMKFILLENGYTEKKVSEIHHDHLIKNFIGLEKIVKDYLND